MSNGTPMDFLPKSLLNDTPSEVSYSAEDLERIDPKALSGIMQLAQLGQMNRIRKALERRQFKGIVNEIILPCTDSVSSVDITLHSPPWVSVVFYNDGPNTAFISINRLDTPFTVLLNESHPTDYSDADQRVFRIYFWCGAGNTASVRAKGKY